MNCYRHPSMPAVAQCPECGKGLCAECASVYTQPICNVCNRRLITNEKSRIIKELLLTFGIGVLLAVFFIRQIYEGRSYSPDIFSYVVFIYAFSGIVPGWKTLTRLTPAVFLFLPIIGWLLYFIIKLALSLCLGLVMLPIRTVRNIARLIKLQKIRT